jgi:uncharacterized protein YecE (DUF72 family)
MMEALPKDFRTRLAGLADQGVFIGTSSWKYPGWRGQLYQDDRYVWRGRFSEARFEKLCLAEYSEFFRTVCVDAAYYKFPDKKSLEQLFPLVPDNFLFSFKVTDRITLKRFPNLPRHGTLAGTENPDFLNPELFEECFLEPCRPFQSRVGLLIFEFSRFHPTEFERGRDFAERMEGFLSRLPKGWRYGMEIRNRSFLHPEYFAILSRQGVSHIYNSWDDMPPIDEQLKLAGSRTTPEFFGARMLLRPGRKYEEAVKLFSPYNEVKDPYPECRTAGANLIRATVASKARAKGFIYVNNRLEGNALSTIARMIEEAEENAIESPKV